MPVTFEHSGTHCVVRLNGQVTIVSAAELRDRLVCGLATDGELRVEVKDATGIDVTTVQLLWALDRVARETGKLMLLEGPVPEAIVSAFASAGLPLPGGAR